jgi:hypothetical protein
MSKDKDGAAEALEMDDYAPAKELPDIHDFYRRLPRHFTRHW